jgi:hypothetical protein
MTLWQNDVTLEPARSKNCKTRRINLPRIFPPWDNMSLTTSLLRQFRMSGQTSLSRIALADNSRHYFHSTTMSASDKTNNESQGHVIDPSNKHKKDPQSQSAHAGSKARSSSNHALDAASPHHKQKPERTGSGNKEGIGMIDQVGSQSASGSHFEVKDAKEGSTKK